MNCAYQLYKDESLWQTIMKGYAKTNLELLFKTWLVQTVRLSEVRGSIYTWKVNFPLRMSILYKLATPENISKLTILLKVINHLCITTPQDIDKLQDLFITINVPWLITKAIFLLLYFVIHGRRGKSLTVFFTIYISVSPQLLVLKYLDLGFSFHFPRDAYQIAIS